MWNQRDGFSIRSLVAGGDALLYNGRGDRPGRDAAFERFFSERRWRTIVRIDSARAHERDDGDLIRSISGMGRVFGCGNVAGLRSVCCRCSAEGNGMHDPDGVTIAIGILLGMFYFRQTGESPGGIITPGLVAMRFSNPQALGLSLGVALLLGLALRFFFRRFPVYGRQRVAFAIAVRARRAPRPSGRMGTRGVPWLGWVVPGLVAADIERQGIAATFSGLASVSVAVSWGASLVMALSSCWR
jgi:hypothetical protein